MRGRIVVGAANHAPRNLVAMSAKFMRGLLRRHGAAEGEDAASELREQMARKAVGGVHDSFCADRATGSAQHVRVFFAAGGLESDPMNRRVGLNK